MINEYKGVIEYVPNVLDIKNEKQFVERIKHIDFNRNNICLYYNNDL